MSFRPGKVSEDDELEVRRPLASTSRLPDLPLASESKKKKKVQETIVIESEGEEEVEEEAEEEEVEDRGMEQEEEDENEGLYDELVEEEFQIANLSNEISTAEVQLSQLEAFRHELVRKRNILTSNLNSRKLAVKRKVSATTSSKSLAPPPPPKGSIDYVNNENFPWKRKIKEVAKEVFGIDAFRLSQEAIINASLDGRDIVVVLRTGGGKSLTYQLPALISKGTSIVITPLISLMQDQTFNLKRQGVSAEMLSSGTSSSEAKDIHARMVEGLEMNGKGKGKKGVKSESREPDERDIKLVYVTPERIEKSKTFVSILQRLYDAGALSRIIIDEAHCISSLGNDFRTSYKSLGRLRTLFPRSPIIACTATAPPSVIKDMIKSLHMKPSTSQGDKALPNTTVLFTSTLYRENLHYSVISKPTAAAAVISLIVDYIQEKHSGHCGVIYCLSRSDTEAVSKGIYELSKGKTRCAVYHAGIDDAEKIRIHTLWRERKIQVIVATNAFGLGIDAPDVRFVIHHSMAKSLESYYQESGRAGRDGKDSDCVIFYRSADATRLSTLIYADFASGGKEKLYGMVAYAEDLVTCRKLAFANYFEKTHESRTAFEEGGGGEEVCGHCDNCLRDPESYSKVDVSLQVYKTLRILSGAQNSGATPTITLTQLCDLVRGLGGGKFGTQQPKGKGEGKVDVQKEAGGKVTLSKEETESLVVLLLIEGYLAEQFHATAYNTISYLRLTTLATRFTRIEPEYFTEENSPKKIYMNIQGGGGGKKKQKRKSTTTTETKVSNKKQKKDSGVTSNGGTKKGATKVKEKKIEEEEEGEEEEEEYDYAEEEALLRMEEEEDGSDEVELDEDGWQVFGKKKEPSSRESKKVMEVLDLMDSDSE